MKYNVQGADQDTGDSMQLQVEAADEASAREIASRKGVLVSHVSPAAMTRPAPQFQPGPYQSLEQGHVRGAPVINVAPPRRGSSLGVVSLVLGLVAFMICWIPFINLLGVPLSALGLVLGLVGLLVAFTRNGASIGYPIAGTAVCALALFIAISMTGALVTGIGKAGEELARENERRDRTNQTTSSSSPGVPSTSANQSPAPTATGFVLADSPVRQGETQVQVRAVRVGKVSTRDRFDGGKGESREVLLAIELEISNLSATKKLEYHTWGGTAMSFGTRTALRDNFGNTYKLVNFGFGTLVAGAVESESIYPGKSASDVLVFEEPVGQVEFLDLELPASQFDGEGTLRIRIPASMIERKALP